jgi:hypothetical protein
MTQPDPIVVYTIRDQRTLACPLCPHTIDVPPVPVSNAVGEALGMSGTTLAAVHAEQVAKRVSADMRKHLEGHDVLEWLAAVVPDGVAAVTR